MIFVATLCLIVFGFRGLLIVLWFRTLYWLPFLDVLCLLCFVVVVWCEFACCLFGLVGCCGIALIVGFGCVVFACICGWLAHRFLCCSVCEDVSLVWLLTAVLARWYCLCFLCIVVCRVWGGGYVYYCVM